MDQRKKAASRGTTSSSELFIAVKMDGPINIRLTLSGNVNHQGHGSSCMLYSCSVSELTVQFVWFTEARDKVKKIALFLCVYHPYRHLVCFENPNVYRAMLSPVTHLCSIIFALDVYIIPCKRQRGNERSDCSLSGHFHKAGGWSISSTFQNCIGLSPRRLVFQSTGSSYNWEASHVQSEGSCLFFWNDLSSVLSFSSISVVPLLSNPPLLPSVLLSLQFVWTTHAAQVLYCFYCYCKSLQACGVWLRAHIIGTFRVHARKSGHWQKQFALLSDWIRFACPYTINLSILVAVVTICHMLVVRLSNFTFRKPILMRKRVTGSFVHMFKM